MLIIFKEFYIMKKMKKKTPVTLLVKMIEDHNLLNLNLLNHPLLLAQILINLLYLMKKETKNLKVINSQ